MNLEKDPAAKVPGQVRVVVVDFETIEELRDAVKLWIKIGETDARRRTPKHTGSDHAHLSVRDVLGEG